MLLNANVAIFNEYSKEYNFLYDSLDCLLNLCSCFIIYSLYLFISFIFFCFVWSEFHCVDDSLRFASS